MVIQVNGKELEVEARTLAALLTELEYEAAHVATALNQDFVQQIERADILLKEGDRVEILTPRQGG